jgi:predicted nucleic acid-binding protein
MSDSLFVDTNVLIYFRDSTEPQKQAMAEKWLRLLWQTNRGRISFQVLNEYYNAVTCKLERCLDRRIAQEDVNGYLAWKPVPIDANIIREGWTIQERFKYAWWDALIIAAARLTRCAYLLTEDMQSDQDIDGLRIVNPFTAAPETIVK